MVERREIEKLRVERGVRDSNTGSFVDIVGDTRFPSTRVLRHEEWLWFLLLETDESRALAARLPPVRRPQTLGVGHGLADRLERQKRYGHMPMTLETPDDFRRDHDAKLSAQKDARADRASSSPSTRDALRPNSSPPRSYYGLSRRSQNEYDV
jgi:hypothetical protein